jgi:hypothetical protein
MGEEGGVVDAKDGGEARGGDLGGSRAAADGVLDAVEGEFAAEEVEELAGGRCRDKRLVV